LESDVQEMQQFKIPEIDLVIVDLYPFEETVASTNDESLIIEKIDIGGPSMIRAAAKNHRDVVVVAAKKDYAVLEDILNTQNGSTELAQRREFAIKAFDVCSAYDIAISNYFHQTSFQHPFHQPQSVLRYGENPHQPASFYGNLQQLFTQLHGKELSYNNLVDVDAALQLLHDINSLDNSTHPAFFAIIKHTNVCGCALRPTLSEAWKAALAGDPESAFGGIIICNAPVDLATATAISEIFFEVLIAPSFDEDALKILQAKKNRILLQLHQTPTPAMQQRSLLNGVLMQQQDAGNFAEWKEVGGRTSTDIEKAELQFANLVGKHLKSNSIAIVKNYQLIGKGCGQTSRVDSLRQALEKARQFNADVTGAVLSSDAFFPFDDCVKIAHAAGIQAFIQPGGSIRDNDSIQYCVEQNLAMVITGLRHFKH
jgi:phosphoribosylaminoimidazolecarboxamide formyltransferase/IMP cyclohydrolase